MDSKLPEWPLTGTLADAHFVESPHPSLLPLQQLEPLCRFRADRRGGPGGQHRNKVSSTVIVVHEPTGTIAEASERRDQSQNRKVAIDRLRLRLAIAFRTSYDSATEEIERHLRNHWRSRPLKIGESNHDRLSVLTLLMDDLHRAGGMPSLVSQLWDVSTSSIVQLIAGYPAALVAVNQWRLHHGRSPLKAN